MFALHTSILISASTCSANYKLNLSKIMDIGLAGISLAFQIFAACIQGFAIVAAACTMTKDARLMGCILGLEEQKLLAWARMSGLLDDKMDRRLNTDAILLALRELSLLLNDREKLRSYGLTVDPAGSVDDVPASLLDANNPLSQEGVDDGRHKADRKAVLRKADKALVMGKRLRWALFDKTQMESYIQRVHSLVDNLQSLLGFGKGHTLEKLSISVVIEDAGQILYYPNCNSS